MEYYISELSILSSWFKIHDKDLPKYYEYTMHQLIIDFSLEELYKLQNVNKNVEDNLIRMIRDTKDFIKNHLLKLKPKQEIFIHNSLCNS